MSKVRLFILAWLGFGAILGGHFWSPPGGLRHALEVKHAIAGGLRAHARATDQPGDPVAEGGAPVSRFYKKPRPRLSARGHAHARHARADRG